MSTNAVAKAVALGRRVLDQQPDDASAMRNLAAALDWNDQHEEAEMLFRRAVKAAPEDWHGHAALGLFLCDSAGASLFRDSNNATSLQSMLAFVGRNKLSAAAVDRCRELLSEGGDHLDTAIRLAPDDADARMARLKFRGLAGLFRLFIRVGQGEEPKPLDLVQAVAPITSLPDLRRALELRPEDPRLAAIGAYFEVFIAAGNRGLESFEDLLNGSFYQSLSDSEQRALRNKLQRLENLAQYPNPTVAAVALQHLGGLQLAILRDLAGAERNLRRAVALDPKRTAAWDGLLASMTMRDNHEAEFLAVSEELIRVKPNSRSFIILAKACEQAGKMDRSLRAAEDAVRADTNSFLASHTLGVVQAMSAKSDDQLQRALEQLRVTSKRVSHNTPAEDAAQFFVNAACCCGLHGDFEEGLKLVQEARRIDPKDKDAEEVDAILKRMNGTGKP